MSRPATSSSAHPLTFRVMRLTAATPSRRPTLPFVCSRPEESPDNKGKTDTFLSDLPKFEGEGAPGSVGTVSILPASFGSIYAAETFRSFISTYNFSGFPVHSVAVSIEIQTSSQRRISLVSTRTPANLPVRGAVSHVVSSSLPELGVHVLICSAAYVDRSGAARTLRQLFRFNVLPPLEPFVNVIPLHRRRLAASRDASARNDGDPSPKPGLPSTMAQFLVDLRIQNTMPVPVFITSASLEAGPAYTAVIPLIRKDDPAAQQGRAEDATTDSPEPNVDGLEKLSIGDKSEIVVEGSQAIVDAKRSSPASPASPLPPRMASIGVGDTRNFMFYVARPLDSSEMTPSASAKVSTTRRSPRQSSSGQSTEQSTEFKSGDKSDATLAHPLLPSSHEGSENVAENSVNTNSGKGNAPPLTQPRPGERREIGHFSLRWHSGTGEQGHMENVIAAFEPSMRSAEIDVRIAAIPQHIRVQCPFAARCVARNNGSKAVRLYLQVRRDLVGEIVPLGVSGVALGEVAPGNVKECLLSLIPLSRGQHSISGVRVVDIDTRKSFNAESSVVSVL